MNGGTMNKKTLGCVAGAALALTATGCYKNFDFDADSKADFYYVDQSSGDWIDAESLAVARDSDLTEIAVPADWDNDHFWDKAVLTSTGDWITNTSLGTINYPAPPQLPAYVGSGDHFVLPVPADYDGDGTVEPAWYRDSDATWFIEGMAPITFGTPPSAPLTATGDPSLKVDQDLPEPADYDGDKKTDLATFNPRTRIWQVRSSISGTTSSVTMPGNASFPMPAPGDYDGVGHAQRAVAGADGWVIEGHASPILWGNKLPDTGSGDNTGFPAAADYDGDNKVDPSYVTWGGTWKTLGSKTAIADVVIPGGLNATPLQTGYNLNINIARLSFVGYCVTSGPC